MPVHHFTCEGLYVRLLLRRGRRPLAYHPGTRERLDPLDLRFNGRLLEAPPGALGPRPVVLSFPLIQCWVPEDEWKRWHSAAVVPSGQRALLERIEDEILRLEAEPNFEDLLIDPELKPAELPSVGEDEDWEDDREEDRDDGDDGKDGQTRPASYWGGAAPVHWGDLPELEEGETEIVSILMKSTMGDLISVRARRKGDVICFRVVDEYEDRDAEDRVIPRYCCEPAESAEPLTLGEIKSLLWSIRCDGYGQIFEKAWDEQRDGPVSEYENDFYELASNHYEGLQEWLGEQFRNWKCQQV